MALKTVLRQDGGTIGQGVPVETSHKSLLRLRIPNRNVFQLEIRNCGAISLYVRILLVCCLSNVIQISQFGLNLTHRCSRKCIDNTIFLFRYVSNVSRRFRYCSQLTFLARRPRIRKLRKGKSQRLVVSKDNEATSFERVSKVLYG